jgi:hypothetical protein
LEDEDAAKVWIIRNQFGRRNLAPFTRVELALKLEPLLREKAQKNQSRAGGDKKSLLQKSGKAMFECSHCGTVGNHICSKDKLNTQKELAKIAGVSHDTIAKGKLVAEHADEETKDRLRRNQVSVHRVAKDIKEKRQREARPSATKRRQRYSWISASSLAISANTPTRFQTVPCP